MTLGHCIVIGAGIAGACVAESLARRGWQVTVLDAAAEPASGASALPAGLYAPYLSADHNLTSQITARGVEVTQQLATRLLIKGVDWQPSGVMARKNGQPDFWQADAGWIKPAALVRACLSQPRVNWRGNCHVKHVDFDAKLKNWAVINHAEVCIAQADMLVVAAALGSVDLLNHVSAVHGVPTLKLQAVRGQVTFGAMSQITDVEAHSYPLNGQGSFVATDTHWMVGASYDRDNSDLNPRLGDQTANFERLQTLSPRWAESLKRRFEQGDVQNWVGVRCTYKDRLPIVGQLAPGLWLCTAMASRGLTFAPLCAEVLAALRHHEVLPLSQRQVQSLGVTRTQK